MLQNRQKGPKFKSLAGIDVVIKGSPSSGHYGHLGRPGKVGGSQRGSLRSTSIINPKYFSTKKWRKVTEELTHDQRNELERRLETNGVSSNHLNGLTKITTEHSEDASKGEQWKEKGGVTGYYHRIDHSIHLNPIEGRGFTSNTFLHELGHHVYQTSKPNERNVLNDLHSALRREVFRDYGEPVTGRPGQIVIGEEGNLWLSDMGLRQYSLHNNKEFFADVYKLAMYARRPSPLFPGYKPEYMDILSREISYVSSDKYPHDPPMTLDSLFRHRLLIGPEGYHGKL